MSSYLYNHGPDYTPETHPWKGQEFSVHPPGNFRLDGEPYCPGSWIVARGKELMAVMNTEAECLALIKTWGALVAKQPNLHQVAIVIHDGKRGMTPEAQRIAIAEVCGAKWMLFGSGYVWLTFEEGVSGFTPSVRPDDSSKIVISESVPNYTGDLNAMHAAKRTLLTTGVLCDWFNDHLLMEKPPRPNVEFETDKWTWGQSAEVECRALLKTLNLWKEDAPTP